jgi:hypothetical protein
MPDLTNSPPDDITSPNDQIQETPRPNERVKEYSLSMGIPQKQFPDPTESSTDEYSDSDSSESDIEQPLDWDDMDPDQRHAWIRDHPSSKSIHSKLMNTETRNLTKTQRKRLMRIKKPKLFDSKPTDTMNKEPSLTPNYECLPEQPTPTPHPLPQIPSNKRDREDEFQTDQPTHKQPRQLSPSPGISSDYEPQQPELPTPNEEDYYPTPTLIFDPKHQQQQDNTQINKKQKCQENAVLLTDTEPHLSRTILPSDPVPAPSDSPLESLTIPTPNQMIPQSQTIEPTLDETASDSPNQESKATETHDIAHHSAQSQTPPQKPSNWNEMSKKQKKNWYHRQLG